MDGACDMQIQLSSHLHHLENLQGKQTFLSQIPPYLPKLLDFVTIFLSLLNISQKKFLSNLCLCIICVLTSKSCLLNL